MKLHFKKLRLVLPCFPLHFVGWVEPYPGFVGFRCTQSNLHVTGVIAKCETQQQPISEPNHEVSLLIRLAVFLARGGARVKLHEIKQRTAEFRYFLFQVSLLIRLDPRGQRQRLSANHRRSLSQ
jgi:hypothetical protein